MEIIKLDLVLFFHRTILQSTQDHRVIQFKNMQFCIYTACFAFLMTKEGTQGN